jgi:hypothetical protein
MFYMMKTSYISHGPDHRKSWKVDLTIYSTDKNAPEGTGQSTSKMRTRAHIYSENAAQVNFSSHEYQTLETLDNIPGAHEDPKPMIWKTPPVFTSTPSESLVNPTPIRMNPPSSTPARDHENRMSTGSMKKSPASTTSKSDVKKEVLSTPRRSTRMQFKHPVTLSPATATTEMDTTTPALAKLGRMVIEHLQSSGGAISQMQNSGGAVATWERYRTLREQYRTLREQYRTLREQYRTLRERSRKEETKTRLHHLSPEDLGQDKGRALNAWTNDNNASSRQTRHHTMER